MNCARLVVAMVLLLCGRAYAGIEGWGASSTVMPAGEGSRGFTSVSSYVMPADLSVIDASVSFSRFEGGGMQSYSAGINDGILTLSREYSSPVLGTIGSTVHTIDLADGSLNVGTVGLFGAPRVYAREEWDSAYGGLVKTPYVNEIGKWQSAMKDAVAHSTGKEAGQFAEVLKYLETLTDFNA
jgi:hypothetical protein